MFRTITLAAAPLTVAVLTAPTANADKFDFISDLDNNGVYYSSITDTIDVGKIMCKIMRVEQTPVSVGAAANYGVSQGFARWESATMVVSAATNMCQDALPLIDAFARSGPSSSAMA